MGTKGEQCRQRIIAAADTLFYEQGFNHTSFSDIADAAGIARGNFYYHFKTKDEILQGVIEKRLEDFRAMLAYWDETISDPRKRLRRYIQILTRQQQDIEHYGCPIGTLCNELAKLQHAQLNDANQMFEIFRQWLEAQFRQLGRGRQARHLALHLLAWAQGVATITNAYSDPAFLRREAKQITAWLDGL
ncbi:MAG TPA: TetR/AcrR family transcriptional regulator [Gammaproteobacteria bacterium]|nr:TetR/AcrR family transcriptional regulator [Gammaproteobacteria bacterium]